MYKVNKRKCHLISCLYKIRAGKIFFYQGLIRTKTNSLKTAKFDYIKI